MSFFKSLFSTSDKDGKNKMKSESYVNYVSKDNNIKIKLPKEYKQDDVADYDFYAGYEDKFFLGMYVYNLNEYKGYTENQILNIQFTIMNELKRLSAEISKRIDYAKNC